MPKRVVVAMSGGVDSSLTAALLLKEGYEVIGVTMQIWQSEPDEVAREHGGCCSLAAVDDARSVANKLGIPYYVMNFRELFAAKVIEYFCDEYARGRTPNPCIVCNRYIKFEAFLQKALALEADYIATGHYAKIRYDAGKNRYLLYKSVDAQKDQTYALYNLTQYQLKHTLFPLGDLTKEQTREMARQFGLAVADKPDSQEICFIPDNDYKQFLQQRIPERIKPGEMVDTKGERVGTHYGLPFYTVGQRKGLGINALEPHYVVALDPERNRVVIGRHEEVFARRLVAGDLNFIPFDVLDEPKKVTAKIRYTAQEAPATIIPLEHGEVEVVFATPQRAITPGQAVVFYDDEMVVGGGTIKTVING